MELVTPGIGLLFWMLLSFSIVLWILKKFAWKPILTALDERENTIDEALKSAEKAKAEMAKLKADNEKIIADAKLERDNLLKEAREVKEQIIADAKTKAGEEAEKIIATAKENIENEKNAAINEIKNSIATLSIDIAEKILRQTLQDKAEQKKLVEQYLEDVRF